MNYITFILLSSVCLFAQTVSMHNEPLELKKTDSMLEKRIAMRFLLVTMPESDEHLTSIAQTIKIALERSGQFAVTLASSQALKNKQDINSLFHQGYALIAFLNHADNNQAIEWRLYDATQIHMVKGKKTYKKGIIERGWAYAVADEIWPELTQQPSCFSSKIAYVKNTYDTKGKKKATIYLTDFDGSHAKELIATNSAYVGLYWHNNIQQPRLLCSRFTCFNAQIITVTMQGSTKTVLDREGTCVGISLHNDTNQAVYCRSGEIWRYNYNPKTKKGLHTCLVKNKGKNTSPTLLSSGDIIFCSDDKKIKAGYAKAKGPQICLYHADTKNIELLTQEGYCVAPAYCSSNNCIAYSKKVQNTMQLYTYNLKTKKHTQLTTDAGDKTDCTWSPCGTYLAFCYALGKSQAIAIMHVILKDKWVITPADAVCSYPAWSPVYTLFPG